MNESRPRAIRIVRRACFWLVLAGLAGGAAIIAGVWTKQRVSSTSTAEVTSGEFIDYIQLRGEVKARKSTFINAPFNAGQLQIIKLCPNGARVSAGDVVVQFDTMNLQRTADQNRSALRQAEAEIDRMKAQQRLKEEQSLTDLMKVQYDIERARLNLVSEELQPAIEVEKARLELAKAEQRLLEFEARKAADRVALDADLVAGEQKRAKAQSDLEGVEKSLTALSIRAPIEGMVTLMTNSRARTNLGSAPPVFKEGDQAWAGAIIAEIPDLNSIQVYAPVDESERGRIALQQPVSLRIDAVPDREHKGEVGTISPLAKPDYSSWPIKKSFDLIVNLEQADPRLRPGMSATLRVAVECLPDSILIPIEALFEKNGRTICYVLNQGRYDEQPIEVTRRGEGRALIAHGLRPGQQVALNDPTVETGQK